MTEQTERVAIITVHGVADQQPGQTVGELARLLCHGGGGPPRYVEGEIQEVLVPVGALRPSRSEPDSLPRAANADSIPAVPASSFSNIAMRRSKLQHPSWETSASR